MYHETYPNVTGHLLPLDVNVQFVYGTVKKTPRNFTTASRFYVPWQARYRVRARTWLLSREDLVVVPQVLHSITTILLRAYISRKGFWNRISAKMRVAKTFLSDPVDQLDVFDRISFHNTAQLIPSSISSMKPWDPACFSWNPLIFWFLMALVFSQANEATRQEVPGQSSRTRNDKRSDGQISVICFGVAKCVTCAKVKA